MNNNFLLAWKQMTKLSEKRGNVLTTQCATSHKARYLKLSETTCLLYSNALPSNTWSTKEDEIKLRSKTLLVFALGVRNFSLFFFYFLFYKVLREKTTTNCKIVTALVIFCIMRRVESIRRNVNGKTYHLYEFYFSWKKNRESKLRKLLSWVYVILLAHVRSSASLLQFIDFFVSLFVATGQCTSMK